MSVDSIMALAKQVGESEIIPFFRGCGEYTLIEVEDLLHSLVAALGHPSPAYRERLRIGLLNDIWNQVYGFNQADYLKWLVLERIEHRVRVRGIDDLNQELRVLANLWDAAGLKEDLDEECEAVEDWDNQFLMETYSSQQPSTDAVENTVGRAIYYISHGDMSGTVSAREAVEYFERVV
jgi:hypothetical protein